MRIILALVLSMTSAPVFADALSCDSFKQGLTDAIHSGGDEVDAPTDFHPRPQAEGNPRVTFEFETRSAIRGTIACRDQGKFESFDAHTDLDAADITEIQVRIQHLMALSSAAACTTDPSDLPYCQGRIKSIFQTTTQDFITLRHQGDEHPVSKRAEDISPTSQIGLSIQANRMYFYLISNLEREPAEPK